MFSVLITARACMCVTNVAKWFHSALLKMRIKMGNKIIVHLGSYWYFLVFRNIFVDTLSQSSYIWICSQTEERITVTHYLNCNIITHFYSFYKEPKMKGYYLATHLQRYTLTTKWHWITSKLCTWKTHSIIAGNNNNSNNINNSSAGK